jgi:hypothetical protein
LFIEEQERRRRKDVREKTSGKDVGERRRTSMAKPVGGEEATASLIRAEKQNREDVDGLHVNPEVSVEDKR